MAQMTPPRVEISKRQEVIVSTEPGKAYQLEWRTGNGPWKTATDEFFSTGASTAVAPPSQASGAKEFRARELAVPPGPAPQTLDQMAFSLNQNGQLTQCIAVSPTRMVWKTDVAASAVYSYQKTGRDRGELKLSFEDGGTAELKLRFYTVTLGDYLVVRKNARGQQLDDEWGGFSYGKMPARFDSSPAQMPDQLDGCRIGLLESGCHCELDFKEGQITRLRGSQAVCVAVPYAYELETPTLGVVTFNQGGKAHRYELRMETHTTGDFVRQVTGGAEPGVGQSVASAGDFTTPPPGTFTNTVVVHCPAPNSLVGRSISLTPNTSNTTTFQFGESTGAGRKNEEGSADFAPFNYNYVRVDALCLPNCRWRRGGGD
jgi:hypothetical protein